MADRLTPEREAEIRAGSLWPAKDNPAFYIDACKELLSEIDALRVVTGETSDGRHTFNELYDHRITLWIALCRTKAAIIREDWNPTWRSEVHSDGSRFNGWFVLGLFMTSGHQITYHLPLSRWDECYFARTLKCAPDFDGHTSKDVLERIATL